MFFILPLCWSHTRPLLGDLLTGELCNILQHLATLVSSMRTACALGVIASGSAASMQSTDKDKRSPLDGYLTHP
jgi:hypothetical protein